MQEISEAIDRKLVRMNRLKASALNREIIDMREKERLFQKSWALSLWRQMKDVFQLFFSKVLFYSLNQIQFKTTINTINRKTRKTLINWLIDWFIGTLSIGKKAFALFEQKMDFQKKFCPQMRPKVGIEFFFGLPLGLVGGIGQPPCITFSFIKFY
jgi:hypothetical protein